MATPANYTKVIDNLFIGNYNSALDEDFITENNIKIILSFSTKIVTKKHSCVFIHTQYRIQDDDFQDILTLFDPTTFLIHLGILGNNGVLVHCEMGVSRSASIIIAYLMKYENMTFLKAYAFLSGKRSIIRPNNGFILQLQFYELLGKNLLGTSDHHKDLLKYLIPINNNNIDSTIFNVEKYFIEEGTIISDNNSEGTDNTKDEYELPSEWQIQGCKGSINSIVSHANYQRKEKDKEKV